MKAEKGEHYSVTIPLLFSNGDVRGTKTEKEQYMNIGTGTASFISSCFNGLNALSEVGILSVAYALASGWRLSLILLFIIVGIALYTVLLIQRCIDFDPTIRSYTDIGDRAFGKTGERISGKAYDYKSDIWSLGIVILECAIGRFPFIQSEDLQSWPTLYELLDAIVSKPPPTAPLDQFSPEFCSFVSGCIQKEPKDRSSALDLLVRIKSPMQLSLNPHMDRAQEYIDEAVKFKICLQTKDHNGAISQVQAMPSCIDFTPEFLSLSAHEAIACRFSDLGPERFFGTGEVGRREQNWFALNLWNIGLKSGQEKKYELCAELFRMSAEYYSVKVDGQTEGNNLMVCKSLVLAVSAMLAGEKLSKNQLLDNGDMSKLEVISNKDFVLVLWNLIHWNPYWRGGDHRRAWYKP